MNDAKCRGRIALVVAGLALALACPGCVRQDHAGPGSKAGSAWWQATKAKQTGTTQVGHGADARASTPEPGRIFTDVRTRLLSDYPQLELTPANLIIGLDVSGDMVGDNLLQVAEQFLGEMGRYFLVSGDVVAIAPWDQRMRADLRRETMLGPKADPYRAISDLLPPANPDATPRKRGSLPSVAEKELLQEALRADAVRPTLVMMLSNLRVDNPTAEITSPVTPAELRGLEQRFANRSGMHYIEFEHPMKPTSPHHLYVSYLLRPAATLASTGHVDRRRAGTIAPVPRPLKAVTPLHQSSSPLTVVLGLALFVLGVAVAAIIWSVLTIEVEINGRREELRVFGGTGKLVANEVARSKRSWNVDVTPPLSAASVSVAKVRHSAVNGLLISANDGVSFAQRDTRRAQVTQSKCQISCGGHAGFSLQRQQCRGDVTVAVPDWRQVNAGAALALYTACLLVAAGLVLLLVA